MASKNTLRRWAGKTTAEATQKTIALPIGLEAFRVQYSSLSMPTQPKTSRQDEQEMACELFGLGLCNVIQMRAESDRSAIWWM